MKNKYNLKHWCKGNVIFYIVLTMIYPYFQRIIGLGTDPIADNCIHSNLSGLDKLLCKASYGCFDVIFYCVNYELMF